MINKTLKAGLIVIFCVLQVLLWVKLMFWLAVPLLLFMLTGIILKKIQFYQNQPIPYNILFLSAIFLLAISIKVFLFNLFMVPSGSMENTIMPGDRIVSNKLDYGPALPQTPFDIPWINLLFYLNKKSRDRLGENWWPYKRLKGLTTVKHNDVVLFKIPLDFDLVLVKRCSGLPGDSIQIKNNRVFVNNIQQNTNFNVKYLQKLYSHNKKQVISELDKIGVGTFYENFNGDIEVSTSPLNIDLISKIYGVDSVENFIADTSIVYPYYTKLKWTPYCYGPVYLPQKGDTIILNEFNYYVYRQPIKLFENDSLTLCSDSVYVNGTYQTQYTFKNSYYWMMGDNRNCSVDSRYWGMVPEHLIIAKAWFVLFSKNNGDYNWFRCFKAIH